MADASFDQPPGSAAEQLATLVSFGVRLRPDVDPAEALAPLAPYELKRQPYVAVLSRVAQQPGFDGEVIDPGAPAINVGAFDTEFVEDPDAYEEPIRFMAAVCGASDRISDIASNIDVEAEEGTISYRIDGRLQTWDVEVNDDWADRMVLSYVLDDLLGVGECFVLFSSGQEFGFVLVTSEQQEPLQKLLDARPR